MDWGDMRDFSIRENWLGLLKGRLRPEAETSVFAIVRVAPTGSAPFLGLTTDGQSYWVKYMGNAHGVDSLVAERVVEALAKVLHAPMRPSILVNVPEELTFDKRLDGSGIKAGVAHGSLFLGAASERETLDSVGRDGNNGRQPRFIALWELCAGCDEQWIYDRENDEQVWSYDHGYWITGGEPAPLMVADLIITLRTWTPWPGSVRGMDPSAFSKVANGLEDLTVADLIDVVASVPLAWGVSDELLESLAWWLYHRRGHVAANMRALAMTASKINGPPKKVKR